MKWNNISIHLIVLCKSSRVYDSPPYVYVNQRVYPCPECWRKDKLHWERTLGRVSCFVKDLLLIESVDLAKGER